jgi:small subunit ribosomal protein S17
MAERGATRSASAEGATALRPHEARRRTMQGRVVSNKMQKTVVVAVETVRRHALYGRNMRRTTRFKAHDEENRCQVGDVVIIAESRPISKDKHWVVREIVKETIGPGLEVLQEEAAVTLARTAEARRADAVESEADETAAAPASDEEA